eukprot:7050718-Pyramimonas_sp.AAC.1
MSINIKKDEHGNGGLAISAFAISSARQRKGILTSAWQGYGGRSTPPLRRHALPPRASPSSSRARTAPEDAEPACASSG